MARYPDLSRRRFLRQSFGFSAAAMLGAGAVGCASEGSLDPSQRPPIVDPNVSTDPTHIMMVGDYGQEEMPPVDQQSVANGMKAFVNRYKISPDALFMLGDNFYGDMYDDVNSTRWKTQFEDMYPESMFNCRAYAIPGNHDYELRPISKYLVELAYSNAGGTRWTMPAQWYSFLFPQPNPVMKVIALDSNMPFPNGATTQGTFYAMQESERIAQLAWLESELAAPRTVPFLVVMGHHPVYSDGPHGDHPILVRDWDPLFRKYGVHLYIAGHDHDLQHLEFSGHPTSFFMSGGGGAALYNIPGKSAARGPYARKIFGFSHMRATADLLTIRHLDQNGDLLHKFTKAPDHTVKILY